MSSSTSASVPRWFQYVRRLPHEASPVLSVRKSSICGYVADPLYSDMPIGWSMSAWQDRQLVLNAVLMPNWQRDDRNPVIFHSDRWVQCTRGEYQASPRDHNMICSMRAVGNCGDTAATEVFRRAQARPGPPPALPNARRSAE